MILAPTALGYAVVVVGRGYRRLVDWRRGRARPTAPPIEQLGADLRRLKAQLDTTEDTVASPGKGVRVRAIRGAYLDALRTACVELDVSPPDVYGQQVPRAEIYRVEAALRARGLDVRAS